MPKRLNDDNPLPLGWLENFLEKADLERSFNELGGLTHFYVEALRGSIRSQQLRFDEAWEHFDRANELSEKAPENIPNLIRQFLLHIWCFENALVEAPLVEGEFEPPELQIPPIPEEILRDYPEVKLVINLRRLSEALLRLHLGHFEESAEIYRALIEDNPKERGDVLAKFYVGLGACEHNLGYREESLRTLENAGFALLSGGKLLNRVMQAGILYAVYQHIGEDEQAESWMSYLKAQPCPAATIEIYNRRGQILLDRCTEKSSCLVI